MPQLVSRTLDVGGHEVRVHTSVGASTSPVYLLVHGIGMSHRSLARLQRALQPYGTVHCVDLPGFGGTPTPSDAMSIADGAALLGRVLDALDVPAAVLVGHSMGGQLVVELAAQRPALVTHLVLIGPVTDPDRAGHLTQARDLFRDSLREPASGNVLTFADYLRCGPRWYLTELEPMLAYRTDERLAVVAAPTLVIRGTGDPVARHAWCARLADVAPGGSLVEVPGHRHLVQFTAADSTARAVAAFCRRDLALEP
ncbi:alpha/beta fold hydrolase [Cellulomonas fengjieae]|uniref:alpha/beta fold hydrolase n=1 Tax=Cellulomonas fengjieae TaxID=2819978 RepID=UPI001AAEF33C|nr:alpha/beta hydrolase [Cellulomonas fengjieae]MBO3102902.1 alpha/beta hydrolase [Cellulomonas fengjieae]